MDLDIIVFGEYTLRQCLYVVGVVLAVYFVLKFLYRVFFVKKDHMKHSIAFVCRNCGWRGQIGRFAARCPKCNQPVD